jgi:hypothetical protein
MIKTKTIKAEEEHEELVDVICNMCGHSCVTWKDDDKILGIDGLIKGYVEGGFGSKVIGDTVSYSFDLCEMCTMELINKFKIPAKRNEGLTE